MANRRMLSKSISISKKIAYLYSIRKDDKDPSFALLLYSWLHPHADDFGRMVADPFTIKYEIVPTLNKNIDEIQKAITDIYNSFLVYLYKDNDKNILQIINFDEHQTGLGKRTKSKFNDPNPEKFNEFLRNSEKFYEVQTQLN